MKKIFILAALALSLSAGAAFAATAADPDVDMVFNAGSGAPGVPIPCKKDQSYTGGGGGRGGKTTARNAKEYIESAQKAYADIQAAVENAGKSDVTREFDWLGQCLTGINANIFSGGFGGIWDAVVNAVQKKLCAFAAQQSGYYINQALSTLQFQLPGGLGTVGANTSVLGYQITSTGTQTGAGVTVNRVVNGNAGMEIFRNGGSMLGSKIGGTAGGLFR